MKTEQQLQALDWMPKDACMLSLFCGSLWLKQASAISVRHGPLAEDDSRQPTEHIVACLASPSFKISLLQQPSPSCPRPAVLLSAAAISTPSHRPLKVHP